MGVDVVVVGAGHAGIEAAVAAARLGCHVALVTVKADAIGRMSCNPAIGGLGKGHLVREIDALGGQMGLCTDATGIQFRRLNRRKGAAVRGTRVQSDKQRYGVFMSALVKSEPRIRIVEAEVVGFSVEAGCVRGVKLGSDQILRCGCVVLTTGTFLRGLMHVGPRQQPGGRRDEPAANRLSLALTQLGVRLGRLKTGTPCRIRRNSIDYARLALQPGDKPPPKMSGWSHWPGGEPPLPQLDCHITYTNPKTHEIIRKNLRRSAIYSGAIECVGPRYCPSIEDKVVRFADRPRHQIFVEPEGLDSTEVYPNGISTSLPQQVQQELVRSIVGFERAEITRFGYAVEYDYSDPLQLKPTLELRHTEGLFLAGQINGTTGYEEAAAQGLLGGINAAAYVKQRQPIVLGRDQAYAGVMVDDLITQGTREPYRMFTSRAEYRLLLREDNAEERLTPLGRQLGLIDDARWAAFCRRQNEAQRLCEYLADTCTRGEAQLDQALLAAETVPAKVGTPLAELLLRPQVSLDLYEQAGLLPADDTQRLVREQVEIAIKYRGYIDKQAAQARRLATLEGKVLPDSIDYRTVSGLSNEAREKLQAHRPRSLGQASRIAGMTPAAIALLDVHLRRLRAA